jgi:antitoxin component YwqK of YwqJK toxin-antitoxin module
MALSEGNTVNGKKEGYWITYYANGNTRRQGAYKQGIKDGKWIQYFKNGTLSSEGYFKNGAFEMWYVCYSENGHKKWEGDYGPYVGSPMPGLSVTMCHWCTSAIRPLYYETHL